MVLLKRQKLLESEGEIGFEVLWFRLRQGGCSGELYTGVSVHKQSTLEALALASCGRQILEEPKVSHGMQININCRQYSSPSSALRHSTGIFSTLTANEAHAGELHWRFLVV